MPLLSAQQRMSAQLLQHGCISSDPSYQLYSCVIIFSGFVRKLNIRQMLPPVREAPKVRYRQTYCA